MPERRVGRCSGAAANGQERAERAGLMRIEREGSKEDLRVSDRRVGWGLDDKWEVKRMHAWGRGMRPRLLCAD